jgi:hypothetical protein
MDSVQVVCGAALSPALMLGNLGTKVEQTKKLNENALKSTMEALVSVQRKEVSSRLRWIAQCINAARLREVNLCCPSTYLHYS